MDIFANKNQHGSLKLSKVEKITCFFKHITVLCIFNSFFGFLVIRYSNGVNERDVLNIVLPPGFQRGLGTTLPE